MSLRLRAHIIWRLPCRKPPCCIGACPTGAMRREPHGSLLDGHRRPHDNLPVGMRTPQTVPIVTAAEQPLLGRTPRRGWVIVEAGLLTCGSSLRPAFPCPKTQWQIDRRSPLTVAGAVRDLPARGAPGSHIKPLSRHHDASVLRRARSGCQGCSAALPRRAARPCSCKRETFPTRPCRKP